jgi:hypothetical protein
MWCHRDFSVDGPKCNLQFNGPLVGIGRVRCTSASRRATGSCVRVMGADERVSHSHNEGGLVGPIRVKEIRKRLDGVG